MIGPIWRPSLSCQHLPSQPKSCQPWPAAAADQQPSPPAACLPPRPEAHQPFWSGHRDRTSLRTGLEKPELPSTPSALQCYERSSSGASSESPAAGTHPSQVGCISCLSQQHEAKQVESTADRLCIVGKLSASAQMFPAQYYPVQGKRQQNRSQSGPVRDFLCLLPCRRHIVSANQAHNATEVKQLPTQHNE